MAIQFLRGKTTEINQATTVNLQPGQPLLDTTKGCLYINADPDDTAKKVSNPSAFTKFPSLKGTTKGFVKYDGTNYTTTTNVVESIGGASGTIQLGSGLTLTGTTLSATNTSSTSINGLTGTVSILGSSGVEVTKSGQAIIVSAAKVKSVTNISNEYQATDVEGNLIDSGWTSNASEAGFSATKKYLYVRQTITYSDSTNTVNTFINSVWGADGKDGTSVTIKGSYESEEMWNTALEKGEPVAEPGSAYLVAGDLYVWVLGQGSGSGSWQNVGKIQGPKGDKGDAGATGAGATITFKYLASTSNLPSAESSDWDDDLQLARGNLSEDKPILWCQEIVQDASGTSKKIYILETLPYKTYIKYANIDAFDTTTFEPIGIPNIYDTPKSTTGWIGTYSGYAQTAPTSFEFRKYKWAYYLTEINKTNFMKNVLKENAGKDGIYKYASTESADQGTEYIGINASAINTGSLKVINNKNSIFEADVENGIVEMAGWKVSADAFTSGTVGLHSGNFQRDSSLISENSSPVRIFAGPQITTDAITQLVFCTEDWGTENAVNVTIKTVTDMESYYKLALKESLSGYQSYPNLSINSTGDALLTKATTVSEITEDNYKFYIQDSTTILISHNALLTRSKFRVLEDGSLYASAANIEGNIKATSGSIGSFSIENGELKGETESKDSTVIFRPRATGDASAVLEHTAKSSSTNIYKSLTIRADDTIYFSAYKKDSATDRANLSIGSQALLNSGSYVYKNILEAGLGDLEIRVSDSNCSGKLAGTWKADKAIETTSSRNKKHDIEGLDDRYSTLLDNLKPVRFKYNNDNSNCYHTGLILDEMKDAMDTAQIDSSEFAAYCVQDEKTGDGGIRYDELIALLIKEVQELKRKIH